MKAANRLMFPALLCFCLGVPETARPSTVEFFPEPLPSSEESPESLRAGAGASSPAGSRALSEDAGDADEDALSRSSQELRDAMLRRLQSLTDALSEGGYRSEALIDHLASLAALYQELGDHFPAIGALDWALEISRIHNGLYSLEDADLLEQSIESRTALGDYGGAAPLEERLLELTRRHPDDPRVTLILAASADRRLRESQRLLEEGSEEQGTFAIAASSDTSSWTPPPAQRSEALAALWDARWQYAQAIAAGVSNGGFAVLDLLELEEKLIQTFFLEVSHPDLASSSEEIPCRGGEEVLKTSLINVSNFLQSPAAEARTLIRLADWRLLCSRNGSALHTYESAYETLLDKGADEDTIADLLSPEIPAALPAFDEPLDGDDEPPAYRGYVDVSFVVGKYGSPRKIVILDRSAGTTKAVEKKLRKYITERRFRPRFVDGELPRADPVSARFYYR